MINVHIRFYEELNDFLPNDKRKVTFAHPVALSTSVKDVIESLGVPHTEVDLILVNGKSVNFSYQVKENDHISVYPVFEAMDISELVRLRPTPLRQIRFILDVHLGKLARYLRLLGFDTFYSNAYSDKDIIERSRKEKYIVLTRDIGLLKHKPVTQGYWLRTTDPEKQINEILTRFDLRSQCHPFTRCLECNGLLEVISKEKINEELPPMTQKYYHHFMRCERCKKIYWEGTHYQKLKLFVEKIIDH